VPLPEPRLSDDQHGTRCAGEIAAVKNDVCGVGVAYESRVAGIRILSASISDADEASALNFGFHDNDIYSCSWGPPDDGQQMEAPSRLITKAFLNGVQNGRQGKGSLYVFASGNGGGVDDQCNFDGYTNSIFSVTVAAIDRKGLHPYYSEACSANMVVTYSSGSGDNIVSRPGNRAANARSPLHSIRLMLARTSAPIDMVCVAIDCGPYEQAHQVIRARQQQHRLRRASSPLCCKYGAWRKSTCTLQAETAVRPELTWRDVQHLCVNNAVPVNPTDPDWQTTHAGRAFNHKYGYGKLDAWRLVHAARAWSLVKPQSWWQSSSVPSGGAITADGATSTITVARQALGAANFDKLEHVTVTVDIAHGRRGNVEIELESPNGVRSVLARVRRFDEATTGFPGWTFMSVKHWCAARTGFSDFPDHARQG
jgi:kexin